jgi:hypothetical protein
MRCPKCSGELWDNRTTKKSPKQPDYACKNREGCGHAIWPPKDSKPAVAKAEPKPVVPLADLSKEYLQLVTWVASKLAEGPERVNMRATFADAQAVSATIWIQYRRQA